MTELEWIKVQEDTFINWVNTCLKKNGLFDIITDLETDFCSGVNLHNLYQQLTGDNLGPVKESKRKIDCIIAIKQVLDAFRTKYNVKMVNIGAEDIYNKNTKIILGLIWTLILKFQIIGTDNNDNGNQSGAKKILLGFVNGCVKPITVKNFKSDFKNGDVLAKLIHYIKPDSLNPDSEEYPKEPLKRIEKALDIADKELGIEKIIDQQYILDAVDENSTMTYVSLARSKYEERKKTPYPENCVLSGVGVEDGEVSNERSFDVELRNIYNERCPIELPDDPLKNLNVSINAPVETQAVVEIKEPGLYTVKYNAESKGDYVISVSLPMGGPQLKNSPVTVKITGKEAQFSARGELIDQKKFPHNRATGLLILTEDDAEVAVNVKDKDGNPVGTVSIEKNEKNELEVTVDEVSQPEVYKVEISINGELREEFEAECFKASEPSLVEGTFTFTVQAKEDDGSPKTAGGEDWAVTVKGPKDSEVNVQTRDHGDGTYSATYKLAASEESDTLFTVSAMLSGCHVASSPFTHRLSPKPTIGKRIAKFFGM